MLAPPLATWIALRWGWRAAFVATGAIGLALDSHVELGRAPRRAARAQTPPPAPEELLRDRASGVS